MRLVLPQHLNLAKVFAVKEISATHIQSFKKYSVFVQNRKETGAYLSGGMLTVNKPIEDASHFSSKVINRVFVILLLDLLGFTLILPLFPSILDHYAQTGVSFIVM